MGMSQEEGRAVQNCYATADKCLYNIFFSLESFQLYERIMKPVMGAAIDRGYEAEKVSDLMNVAKL